MHQNFSPYYDENSRLKLGEWRDLVPKNGDIKVDKLLDMIVEKYKIPSKICEDLTFMYYKYQISPRAKNLIKKKHYIKRSSAMLLSNRKTSVVIDEANKQLQERPLNLSDIHIRVYIPKGRVVERDINCGSEFMLNVVDEIGESIRKAYSFLPQDHPVHLFMDNAGGHGKKEIKEEYVRKLKDKYNVIVVWQVPHSPESNMLDLGVWMGLQLKVEAYHRLKVMSKDILADSVETCFREAINSGMLAKVHERWQLVLELIKNGNRTNNLVERHRGLKRKLLDDLPTLPNSDDEGVINEQLGEKDITDADLFRSEDEE